jgi:hypothetical protein
MLRQRDEGKPMLQFQATDGGTVYVNPMLVRMVREVEDGRFCRIYFDTEHMVSVIGGRNDVIRRLDEALPKGGHVVGNG